MRPNTLDDTLHDEGPGFPEFDLGLIRKMMSSRDLISSTHTRHA